MAYRKEDFEDVSTNFNCQNVYRIYCAPEVLLRISSSFTTAADVYRLKQLDELHVLKNQIICVDFFEA